MFTYIDRLREKPEAVRRRVAFGISAFVVLILGALWFATLSDRFNDETQISTEAEDATTLGSIKENISEEYEQAKASITNTNPFDQEQIASPSSAIIPEQNPSAEPQNNVIITDVQE